MYASITLLKIKSISQVPAFIKHVIAINKQMQNAPGLKFFKAGNYWLMNNYTFSLWESKEQMIQFMTSGAHLAAMKEARTIASGLFSKGFETEEIPNWKNELNALKEQARKPKLETVS